MPCLRLVQWSQQIPNLLFVSVDESFNPGEEGDEVAEE